MEKLKTVGKILLWIVAVTIAVYVGVIIAAWIGIIVGSLLGELWVNMQGGRG